ncbi:MAG: hypothetical protein HY290_12930 [Planctomycetia bacterium]|nr:hypothetical protein [Planctomycetia bacterium]
MPKTQYGSLAEIKTRIGAIAETMKFPGTPVFSSHLEPLAAAIVKLTEELESIEMRLISGQEHKN